MISCNVDVIKMNQINQVQVQVFDLKLTIENVLVQNLTYHKARAKTFFTDLVLG